MVNSLYQYYVEYYFILKICHVTSLPKDGSSEISRTTNILQITMHYVIFV
jgi:hypothetical protein